MNTLSQWTTALTMTLTLGAFNLVQSQPASRRGAPPEGMQQQCLEQYDTDGHGQLNAEERQTARQIMSAAQGGNRGRGRYRQGR